MERDFLGSMREGFWWVDNGNDIWTGPFSNEEESRRYGYHMFGSYDSGSNRSYGRSILPDPKSTKERIERELKTILADINKILEELEELKDRNELSSCPSSIEEDVEMVVRKINDLK
jgi:hypothetical protein